ncbi:MAG: hypothetical protein COA57_03820 [Flavobacteriales bacterium]|nr:MAG: hypothetical protein COA57_03820 [Flavobacteriales bacterium]
MNHLFIIKNFPCLSIILITVFTVCVSTNSFSTTYYSAENGDWDDDDTWSTVTFNNSTNTGTYPQTGDIVFIRGRSISAINQNNACASLTLYGGINKDTEFFIEGGYTLTVSSDLNINMNGNNKIALLWVRGSGTSAGKLVVNGNVFLTKPSGDGEVRFTADQDAIVTIAGNMTCDHDGGNKDINVKVKLKGQLNIQQNLVLDYSTSGSSSVEVHLKGDAILDVDGNIQFIANNYGKIELILDNNSTLKIAGNFIRGALGSNYGLLDCKLTSTLVYDGSAPQVFAESAGQGFDEFRYNNVVVNNSSATLPQFIMENKAGGGAIINKSIMLTDGVVETYAAAPLTIISGATANSGGQGSYVSGPLKKIGNSAFIFSVGDSTICTQLAISAPSSNTAEFTAQYFYSRHPDLSSDASLGNVSKEEYWRLDRAVTTDAVTVTLFWEDTIRSFITDYTSNDLRVAYYNGTDWTDKGQGAITSSNPGDVTSGSISSFGYFTFGSLNGINPLPIELQSFEVHLNGNRVDIRWVTASQINNDFFTIEKSRDKITFEEVAVMNGMGNSSSTIEYFEVDYEPWTGVSYYRMKQTDFDGNFTYSGIVPVEYNVNSEPGMTIFPNPSNGQGLLVSLEGLKDIEVLVILRDIVGREVWSKVMIIDTDTKVIDLYPEGRLSPGTYLATASSQRVQYNRKLLIK